MNEGMKEDKPKRVFSSGVSKEVNLFLEREIRLLNVLKETTVRLKKLYNDWESMVEFWACSKVALAVA